MNIVWSKKANYSFYKIRNYLEEFWNPLIAQKFINDVLHIIILLEKNPMLGKYNPNLKCREIVISKQVRLYYDVSEEHIQLITFYNNRQKPINLLDL